MTARIFVIGAGAIGSYLAARLVRSGNDVALVGRGQRLKHVQGEGVVVATSAGTEIQRVPAIGWGEVSARPSLAILCTKTYHLPEVLAHLRSLPGNGGRVLALQNGVEAPDQVAGALADATIIAGRVHGFFELEQDIVRHVGVRPSILLGRTVGPDNHAAHEVAQDLNAAGVSSVVAQHIVPELWHKFLLAASLGSVASYWGLSAGRVLAVPEAAAMLREAMTEIASLARAMRIDLAEGSVDEALKLIERFPSDATTSLQRDLDSGRPSEYDALTGAVIRMAERKQVPVPAFASIDRKLRATGRVR